MTTSARRCAVHLNNIRVARAKKRVPAVFRPDSVLVKTSRSHGAVSVQTKPPCPPRRFFDFTFRSMFCSARLSTTDGRTDGRETRTGRKSSPRCSQSPGESTGWNDATAYLDRGTRSVTRARTRSRTPRIPRGERVLVACAARVLLNISRVVAGGRNRADSRGG